MSAPSPSKWSEILSVKSSFASKPCQTQASRRTCGTELCTCHPPSPSKWSEILSVIRSLASKPFEHKLQDTHAALSSAHFIFQVLQNGPRYCSRGFVGGTLGRASDDGRSESFKMVRDTVCYKQFCIKTVPNTSFKTRMRERALHMSSSKSFKMVRDIVRSQQFCVKTVSNTSFKTHMRH